jgi:hypothetical protein
MRILSALLGSVAATGFSELDLVAFSRKFNHNIDNADAILMEAGTVAVAESTEACNIERLAQRLYLVIRTAWTAPFVLAPELGVCSSEDQKRIISTLKDMFVSESLTTLSNYRPLLSAYHAQLQRETQAFEFHLRSALHAHALHLDRRTKLHLRFLGWLRNLREGYAPACEDRKPRVDIVSPLTTRILDMVVPIENLVVLGDLPVVLAIRDRVRRMIRETDARAATIGRALRQAYGIMIERHNRWKQDYLVNIHSSHAEMRVAHPSSVAYMRIGQQLKVVDDLISQIAGFPL